MSERNTFDGTTVLLAGAGCPAGKALATGFTDAGGRVIAIDRNERSVLEIAAHHPGRIDPLRLDVLAPAQIGMFADVWEAEPLDVLVHLQPLRHADDLSGAVASILNLSDCLRSGLKAGKGHILVGFQEMPDATKTLQGPYVPMLERLASTLQAVIDEVDITVNAIHLPAQIDTGVLQDLVRVATWMTAPLAPRIQGIVVRLGAQGD